MGNIAIKAREIEEKNKLALEEVDKKIVEMDQKQQEILSHVQTKTEQVKSQSTILLLVATIIAIILSIGLGLFISNRISKPLEKLSKTVDEVSKGNFNVEIEKTGSIKEINRLADSLDRVMKTMKLAVLEKGEKKRKK